MSKELEENKAVRFELDPDLPGGMRVTFDSDEQREHYRSNPNEIFKIVNSFIAGLCMQLGDCEEETNMYWSIALMDLETCLELFKN